MKPEDIKSAANDLGGRASKSMDDAKKATQDSASDLGAQAQNYAEKASDTAGNLYGRAKDKLSDATDALPDSAADAIAAGKRAYGKGSDQLVRQIAKQPIEALILAGAIGYLVGWATSRS